MDFGVIIGCYRKDYHYARGTVASVRRYMPEVPICLLIDGDFPTDDLKRSYGVQTLYKADVKDEFLRTRSFGYGFSKMVSLWESPFERFLFMDSDAVLLGDLRRKIPPFYQWDMLIDRQRATFTDPQVNLWFFDTGLIEAHFPQFPWRQFADQYYCTGVWAARRGVFPLDEYKAMMKLHMAEPRLFKCGEMGLLNFMIFRAAHEGRVKLAAADIQIVVCDYPMDELERRYSIGNTEPLSDPPDPVVLHYPHPKPTLDKGRMSAPMTYFRRQALRLNGNSALQIEAQMRIEDLKYLHWPQQKATARRRMLKLKSILQSILPGKNGTVVNG